MAPAAFAEAPSPYRAADPAGAARGGGARSPTATPRPTSQARVLRGHAVMAAFRRGGGEVFNAGTTEWAHGLAAADPFVTRITLNVLKRFGLLPEGEEVAARAAQREGEGRPRRTGAAELVSCGIERFLRRRRTPHLPFAWPESLALPLERSYGAKLERALTPQWPFSQVTT